MGRIDSSAAECRDCGAKASASRRATGLAAAVVAAVSYGTNPLWARWLYADGVGIHTMLIGRFLIAALVLGIFCHLSGHPPRIAKRDAPVLATLGTLFCASALGLFGSFRHMDSGIACTLLFVYPVMVAIMMAAATRERADWRTWAALAFALPGVALLTRAGGGASFSWTGFWLVMLSSATYAVYMVIVNVSRAGRLPATTLSFWSFVFCALATAAHAAIVGDSPSLPGSTASWLSLVGLAVVPTIGSLVAMAIAISRIGPTPTALLGSLEPVTAVALGVAAFGEPFTPRYALGIAFILAAVAGVAMRRR